MSTQPEALRLADALEKYWAGESGHDRERQAAAELRRLHAENERLRQIVEDFPPIEAELQEVSDRAHRLVAQRDALLEALHDMLNAESDYPYGGMSESEIAAIGKARAAIKTVEEGK